MARNQQRARDQTGSKATSGAQLRNERASLLTIPAPVRSRPLCNRDLWAIFRRRDSTAMIVHRLQDVELDRPVTTPVTQQFEPNQPYVAVSRCTSSGHNLYTDSLVRRTQRPQVVDTTHSHDHRWTAPSPNPCYADRL